MKEIIKLFLKSPFKKKLSFIKFVTLTLILLLLFFIRAFFVLIATFFANCTYRMLNLERDSYKDVVNDVFGDYKYL